MTAAITQSYGVLAQVIADSSAVHRRLDQLTLQASSGLKSDSYAGLGPSAHIPLDLHPQLAALQTCQDNIDAASGSLQVTQSAMTQMQQIASDFRAQLNNLNGLNTQDVDVIAASARDALTQVANLLDTQYGSVYVFAGQDAGTAPVPAPDAITTSPFFTDIATAVAGLSGSDADTTFGQAVSIASVGGTSPFSAYLSQPVGNPAPPPAQNINRPLVQTGPVRFQPVGLLASANCYATSSGQFSTQTSAVRDLMCSLAVIGSLGSSQASDPNFAGLVQDTRSCLSGAVDTLATEAGALGNVQSSLTAARTQLADTAAALTAQVSSAEDADMAGTLSNLSQVQTQLQASYQLIAGLSGLSLVKFLPAG